MFNAEQIDELSRNKNVLRCSSKSITYSPEFKLTAIRRYYEDGLSPSQIFEEAGFCLDWLGEWRTNDCLKRWKKKYNREGCDVLSKDARGCLGRRKKLAPHKDDKEKIEYLETKIAYLEAENDFLAKLRGLKRK